MDLKQLQSMGAIVPNTIVKRDIKIKRPVMKPQEEWADPEIEEFTGDFVDETVTVHFRRATSADAVEISQASVRERPFVAVFRSVCTPDGSLLFESLEHAMQLRLWLAMPLFEAISEVAGLLPKASRRRTSSGARSRSASAEEQSANGSSL